MVKKSESFKVHIVGICGVAMSGVAILFKKLGATVSGSDIICYPPISEILKEEAIEVKKFSEDNVKDAELVVVGNAISKENPEVLSAINLNKKIMSYPEAINEFFVKGKEFIVVAGTHGKTTTTAAITHFLIEKKLSPSYLIGGVPKGFKNADLGDGEFFIIEGDEYDTAFFDKRPKIHLFNPSRAILTKIDYDHADIFKTKEEYEKAFKIFLKNVGKKISFFEENKNIVEGFDKEKISYGEKGDFSLVEISKKDLGFKFKFDFRGEKGETEINLLGKHNALIMISAYSIINDILSIDEFVKFTPKFQGVKRRLEITAEIRNEKEIYIVDDFAHHPEEVSAGIKSLKEFFDFVVVAFEPRSYTARRNIHFEGFKKAFEMADAIFFWRIFKEETIPENEKLKIEEIKNHLINLGKYAFYIKEDNFYQKIADFVMGIKEKKICVVFMSSGDFGYQRQKLTQLLLSLR